MPIIRRNAAGKRVAKFPDAPLDPIERLRRWLDDRLYRVQADLENVHRLDAAEAYGVIDQIKGNVSDLHEAFDTLVKSVDDLKDEVSELKDLIKNRG